MTIDHIDNRRKIVAALRSELMGPEPAGEIIDLQKGPFEDQPWGHLWSEEHPPEEILRSELPHLRYGVGVLYPEKATEEEAISIPEMAGTVEDPAEINDALEGEQDEIEARESTAFEGLETPDASSDSDSQELQIDSANKFQPASFGISFLVDASVTESLEVYFTGGRYDPQEVQVLASQRFGEEKEASERQVRPQTWHFRRPVALKSTFSGQNIIAVTERGYVQGTDDEAMNLEGFVLRIRCFVKVLPHYPPNQRLVTMVVINDSEGSRLQKCIFQSNFEVRHVARSSERRRILPYPVPESFDSDEDRQIALLYRDSKTFAVGHGCAADWGEFDDDSVAWVQAQPLPVFEAPSTTHDISYETEPGQAIRVPEIEMNLLADPGKRSEALERLEDLQSHYAIWIEATSKTLQELAPELRKTAEENLATCRLTAARLQAGTEFLKENDRAWRAFQIANHAMVLQRSRSRLKLRQNSKQGFGAYPPVGALHDLPTATWRPFQIAFILMALRSAAIPDDSDRELVELIWFPTGGGKTEAYLGLAAFVVAYRRLADPSDTGTAVIMRYTLRLLTQQQLLRASSLICALEFLRCTTNYEDLGSSRFSIGLWVGGGVTPSRRADAVSALHAIQKGRKPEVNLLVLTRCPWCGAEMKFEYPTAKTGFVDGAMEMEQTVKYVCPDPYCFFNPNNEDVLPVEFVDDDIYASPPTIVIGTIDKFATMHGDSARAARSLFGFSPPAAQAQAQRTSSPPSLIIQDELHLISGPLGSTAGLYEALIEELCIDARSETRTRPKVVCSTATIRGFRDQVRALYARDHTQLFPPSGVTAGDSFFAQYARDANKNLLPGKLYVGVHPTGFTSGQTSRVRTFSSLLQAPIDLTPQFEACSAQPRCPYTNDAADCKEVDTRRMCRRAQDPWWTLVIFFNSLRDLGNAISLFQTDLPDYRRVIRRRRKSDLLQLRHAYNPMELTGRLENTEIPTRLAALQVARESDKESAVDVCLASNIIEVGIDVDRLSLLCVVAQPKTTSSYIQVTGRVGRNWKEKPGLVVTIYAADRPRDRSHFEHFRSYHERLYAQVEPTSVTPYARPLLERAFHGVMGAYVRLLGTSSESDSPRPFPEAIYKHFVSRLLGRARRSGFSHEESTISEVASLRMNKWRQKGPARWIGDDEDCLLQPATGNPLQEQRENPPFATAFSMRNVDAPCEMKASDQYMNPDAYAAEFEVDDE